MRTARVLASAVGCWATVVACGTAWGQLVTQPPPLPVEPQSHKALAPLGAIPPGCSLVKRGADNRVEDLSEPAEVAALRKNPLVAPEVLARAEVIIADRRAAFQRIAIDNLDLAEAIEGGLFETTDLKDRMAFSRLLDASKPLLPSDLGHLSRVLEERSVLTHEQSALNDRIAREYKLARAAQDAGGDARRSLALMYKQSLDEPLMALRSARLAAASKLPTLIPRLGLDPHTADSLLKLAHAAPDDDNARLAAIAKINSKLTLEQRRHLLREAVAAP